MKIALFIPSLRGGGAERVFCTLANSFSRNGYIVDLILANVEGPYLSYLSSDVNIVDLRKKRVRFCLPGLISYLNNSKPDILISAMNHTNMVALLAIQLSIRCDIKIYPSVRNTLSKTIVGSSKQNILYIGFMKWLYARADKIITVSCGVAEDLKALLNLDSQKIKIVYNPVINDRLLKKSEEDLDHPWFKPDAPPIVLGAGRLTKQKDFETLIKAFSILLKKKDARLIILGEGEGRKELESLVLKLKISEKVDLPGFVVNPFKYMKQADVFVLSSRWEGLPGVLIQAMACGAPVVSTNCPNGPREILKNGEYGELVPVGDAENLSTAILCSIKKNNQKNLHEKGRGLERFQEKKVLKKYFKLLGV